MNDIVPIEESPEAVLVEIRTASEAFGAAREGTHIAAYAQKRVIQSVTWLLAEGRWALAGLKDAGALVDEIRLKSYRLSDEERQLIEQAVKDADASISNRRLAKMLGVSHTLVNEDISGKNFPSGAENDSKSKGEEDDGGNNLPPGASGPVRGTQGTGDNEWFTPVEHIERARQVLGEIDLDPASHVKAQKRVRATQFFTKSDDGLKREWRGKVWLNPPYVQPDIELFVDKLLLELSAGRATEAILLTHNYTDTAWFQKAAGCSAMICFTRGRIAFESPTGEVAAPTQGQAFTYFGENVARFAEFFRPIGFITYQDER
jgi:phage N-6-adenine-methyltransferase